MVSLEPETRRFHRVSLVASFVLATVALGACGGSGTPPTPKPSSAPSPPVTPTAIASQGASLQYAGSMSQTITTTYAEPGPVPSGTPQAVGVQTLAWTSQESVASSPAPGSNAVQVTTVDNETMTSPSQTTQTVGVANYQYPAGDVGDVYVTGARSASGTPGLASSITTVATEYGSGNGLVDILPEKAGSSWTDDGAMTTDEIDPGGATVRRTVAAGGAYTSSATFPALGGGSSVTTRAIADNADGSGTYTQTDLIGGTLDSISYAAPSGGSVVITFAAPASNSPSPAPAPTPVTVPVWFAVPVVLYAENESVVGVVPVPSACNLAAQFGSTATEIDDTSARTDTVLGTIETLVRKTYDDSGTTVCVQSNDTLAAYYDYSGANVVPIDFFGTNWQTTVTTQTLGLTSVNGSATTAARETQSIAATPHVAVPLRPVGFEALVANVRRRRERDVEAALSQKEIR